MKKFKFTVVTMLTIGTCFTVISPFKTSNATNNYAPFQIETISYDNAYYSSQTPAKATTKKNKSAAKTEPESYHTVSTNTLSVRSKPSANSSVVKKLRYKDKVIILESVDAKWVKVQAGAVTGYAYRKSLSLW